MEDKLSSHASTSLDRKNVLDDNDTDNDDTDDNDADSYGSDDNDADNDDSDADNDVVRETKCASLRLSNLYVHKLAICDAALIDDIVLI